MLLLFIELFAERKFIKEILNITARNICMTMHSAGLIQNDSRER